MVNTAIMLKALKRRHPETQWAFFEELRAGTGFRKTWADTGPEADNPEQRFDAWAINLYVSMNYMRIAYEIKLSRRDFMREMSDPLKREQAFLLSNCFYFVTPVGVVKPGELPPEVGLIEVLDEWISRLKVRAPARPGGIPTWQFFAAIARRVQAGILPDGRPGNYRKQ